MHKYRQQLQTSASAISKQAQSKGVTTTMMFSVTLKWVGSNKVLNHFDFDFDQPSAAYCLQQLAAKAIGCEANAARVKYVNSDLNLNLDLAIFPLDSCAPGVDRYERNRGAWSTFRTALTNVKALGTEAEKPSIALHVTLFSQELLWIDKIWSQHDFDSCCFREMPEKARASRRVALAAVTCAYNSFKYADSTLQADRAFVLACCQRCGFTLASVRASLKADREIVLAAVQENGYALKYASLSLRADKEVVLAAVTRDRYSFKYADPTFQADRAFVLACCRRTGYVLEYVCALFQADREIVLAAVTQQGDALKYASLSLRADKEVVLAAVRSNSSAIICAASDLQADDEVRAAANLPHLRS